MSSYKNQKWKDEYIEFLFEIKNCKTKQERHDKFKEKFPETDFSIIAISQKASDIGATRFTNKKKLNVYPLYTERVKKGYVRIKVSEKKWMPKQKWVYLNTHPESYLDMDETDVFIFLDGDNMNFSRTNIERLKRSEQPAFMHCGGIVKGNPELTKLNLTRARLKLKILDLGVKTGDVTMYPSGQRIPKEYQRRKAKEYREKKKNEIQNL